MICCKTTIGYGSPNFAGHAKTHGSPLGTEEIEATKKKIGWDFAEFEIPDEIYKLWDATAKGEELEADWQQMLNNYIKKYPELAQELQRRTNNKLPKNWRQTIDALLHGKNKDLATRTSSKLVLDQLSKVLPELLLPFDQLIFKTYSGIQDFVEKEIWV